MFDEALEAADRLADAVRGCEIPAEDNALLARVRAAVAARNAADGLLAPVPRGSSAKILPGYGPAFRRPIADAVATALAEGFVHRSRWFPRLRGLRLIGAADVAQRR